MMPNKRTATSIYTQIFIIINIYLAEHFCWARIVPIGSCSIAFYGSPCDNEYVKMYLFTRNFTDIPQLVEFGDDWDNITASNYDKSISSKLIIHGYNADFKLEPLIEIKNEYLREGDRNIWMVDWSRLAKGPCYPLVAYFNTQHVGKCVAKFIERLSLFNNNNLDLHIIGFSLGGHIPGIISRLLKNYTVPRVTGLDPANPFFLLKKQKLNKNSANFVDVIHTNALFQGDIETLGHADFYVNSGISQPGCLDDSQGILNCNHHRALKYFSESIRSEIGFWGWNCQEFIADLEGKCKPHGLPILMGDKINQTSEGIYLVKTNSDSPFAKGIWWTNENKNL